MEITQDGVRQFNSLIEETKGIVSEMDKKFNTLLAKELDCWHYIANSDTPLSEASMGKISDMLNDIKKYHSEGNWKELEAIAEYTLMLYD